MTRWIAALLMTLSVAPAAASVAASDFRPVAWRVSDSRKPRQRRRRRRRGSWSCRSRTSRAKGASSGWARRRPCCLTDDLNALGAGAITRDERQQAFERLQVPPAAALTDATVIRIGQLVGASQVVVGSLQIEGDAAGGARAQHRARHRARQRRRHRARPAAGTVRDLRADRAPDRAAVRDRRRPTSNSSIRRSPRSRTTSRGCWPRRRRPRSATSSAALAGQPSFDRARLALWDVYAEQGDHALALAAVAPVPADSPWFAPRAVSGRAVAAQPQEIRRCVRDVQGAGRRAMPTPALLNNLGVVQLRRGGTPQGGQPHVLLQQGGRGRSRRRGLPLQPGLRLLARPRHAGGDLLAARGGPAQSRRRRRALRARAPRSARRRQRRRSDARTRAGAAPVVDATRAGASGRRRRRAEGARTGQAGGRAAARAADRRRASPPANSASSDELARFYLDRGRRLFQQENDRDAMVELNHAIYLSPYLADAHLLLGRIHCCGPDACAKRSTRSRSRCGAQRPRDGACGARRSVPAGQGSRRGPRRSGARPRARSRARPTPGSCWRGSKRALTC